MFAVLSYVIHNMSGWARATVVYMIFTAERSVLHIALRLALSFLEIGGLANHLPQHKYKITLLFMELEEEPLPKCTWEAGRQWCEQVAVARWRLCGRAQRPGHSDKKREEQKGLSKEGWQRKGSSCRGFVQESVTQSLGTGEEKCIAGPAVVMETRSQVCLMRRKTPQNSLI